MNKIDFKLPEFSTEGADSRAPHSSRRDLLEQSKLSRLPQRKPFTFDNAPTSKTAVVAVCAGCGGKLDRDDAIQQRFCGCRQCVAIYGRLDAAADEHDKRKRRETLERFAAEVKR